MFPPAAGAPAAQHHKLKKNILEFYLAKAQEAVGKLLYFRLQFTFTPKLRLYFSDQRPEKNS